MTEDQQEFNKLTRLNLPNRTGITFRLQLACIRLRYAALAGMVEKDFAPNFTLLFLGPL